MIASMAQTQNFPQHRKFIGIPPGGSSHKSSLTTHSSSSFVNSLGGQEYRNHEVTPLAKSSHRWQSDPHMPTRWPNNSNESSGHGCPASDSIAGASSELFGNTIGTKDWEQQVQYMDSSPDRYSASLASMLPGGSPGLGRSMPSNGISSSPLVGGLLSSATRLGQGWNATVDHGNLGLTVDPSKGGFALQGVGHPASLSLPRFSSNPGFAERAARYSAFGNGQYSPSFPLTGNGNVGRALSPSFENESKRMKDSTGSPRSEFLSATCSAEISGRNSVPHGNTSDGIVAESVREGVNGKGEAKASASRLFIGSSGSPDEQDEGDQGQNADDRERVTSESDASDVSRGQETSCADEAMVDLGPTASGTKRKGFSFDDAMKETSSRISKDQKGSGGHSKRFKRIEGAGDKEEQKSKAERSGSENSGISNSPAAKESSKPAEQPKMDYIHVRARRGQATDSHSLAERVRREKISERMKFLQDLVPGCSKVTGKAVMLDEIINYVQSIQRQVEFLSMKLAAVTPRPEFNIDSFFNKQKSQFCSRPGMQLQSGTGYGLSNMVEPRVEHPDSSVPFPRIQSNQQLHLQHGVTRSLEFQQAIDASLRNMNSSSSLPLPRVPIESFGDGLPQVSSLWDGDLHSVVQMGFGQTSQGDLPPGHMKMEL